MIKMGGPDPDPRRFADRKNLIAINGSKPCPKLLPLGGGGGGGGDGAAVGF